MISLTKSMAGALAIACALACPAAVANQQGVDLREPIGSTATPMPRPVPTDVAAVRFTYDADTVFNVMAAPMANTMIVFDEGEKILGKPFFGESTLWRWDGGANVLAIRPLRPNVTTTLTVVTNQRMYNFLLMAGPVDGKRYQIVRFEYPADQEAANSALQQLEALRSVRAQELDDRTLLSAPGESVNPESFAYDYDVDGDADFAPTLVMDNGTFTWMKLPEKLAEQPTIFMIDEEDGSAKTALLNWVPKKNGFVLIQRTADKFLLKRGEKEVRVTKRRAAGGWTPW